MKFQYYPETDSLYVEFKAGPVRGAPTVCPWARPTSASRNLALSVQHSNTLLSNLPYLFQVVIVGPPVLFQPRPEKLLV